MGEVLPWTCLDQLSGLRRALVGGLKNNLSKLKCESYVSYFQLTPSSVLVQIPTTSAVL